MSNKPKPEDQPKDPVPEDPKPNEPQGDPKAPKDIQDIADTAIDSQDTPQDKLAPSQTVAQTPSDFKQASRKMKSYLDPEKNDANAQRQAGRHMEVTLEGHQPERQPDLQAGRKMNAFVDYNLPFLPAV